MKTLRKNMKAMLLLALAAMWMLCAAAFAEDGSSGDNSLYSLGLENAESCSPEFYYSTLEYQITVPAGTTELLLDPVTSDNNASILDISGTTLENGQGTVYITVEAPNGAQVTYTLYVTSSGEAAETETEAATTESQEEVLQRQSESEEALRQQAENESNKAAVETLTAENSDLNSRLSLLMKVLYGLIAFAVLLLFFIINQSLRNKDLKDDLKEAKSQAEAGNEFARKEQNMQNGYYYSHNQGMPQSMNMPNMPGQNAGMAGSPVTDASQSVQAAFGNAPQTLYAQPMQGRQVSVPAQTPVGMENVQEPAAQGFAAQKSAVQEPKAGDTAQVLEAAENAGPTVVTGTTPEPDINVDMIEL